MQGDRSHDEQQKLEKEIRDKTADLEKHKKELALLTNSNKQLLDEKRNITKVIARVEIEKTKIDNLVAELRLENEMIRGELETVVKKKEKTLVSFDVMKLEIKRIKETVNLEADKVYGLENRKYQLEMSMEEREKEIQVHKDILTSELKSAEEERH
jgi:chromosome segregation ATPase